MGKHSVTLGLAGILVVNLAAAAPAQENQQKQTGGRRLAMALPKAPPAAVLPLKPVVPVRTAPAEPVLNPEDEFASRPSISRNPAGRQIPDNVRSVLAEGASRAEQLSRSCNRRIADAIFWLASSALNQNTTISPVTSPNLRWQRLMEGQGLKGSNHSRILLID